MKKLVNSRHAAPLIALAGFSLFSFGDLILKVLSNHYSTTTIAFLTATIILILSIGLSFFDGGMKRILTLKDRKLHIFRGALLTLQYLSIIYAFSVMPIANAYALLFSAPLLTALLSWVILKERLSLKACLTIILGFIGILIILRPGAVPISLAAIGMLIGSLAFALSHIVVRFMKETKQPAMAWPIYAESMVVVLCLPFFLKNPEIPTLPHMGLFMICSVFALGALVAIGASLGKGRPNQIASMQYMQMLWALFFGLAVFNDIPNAYEISGAILVIVSGLLLLKYNNPHQAENVTEQ
jgi:S-adenosylmethionine uptake transporter